MTITSKPSRIFDYIELPSKEVMKSHALLSDLHRLQEEGFLLPKALSKKWVTALRSGDYKQGQGTLLGFTYDSNMNKDVGEYCCLGVLSHKLGMTDDDLDGHCYIGEDFGLKLPKGFLVRNVKKHEFDDDIHETIDISPGPIQDFLSSLNDQDVSFTDIAYVIENYLTRA